MYRAFKLGAKEAGSQDGLAVAQVLRLVLEGEQDARDVLLGGHVAMLAALSLTAALASI